MIQKQGLLSKSELKMLIREVRGFPVPGTFFRDPAPLLAAPQGLVSACHYMAEPFKDAGVTKVAMLESRGFIFGPIIAEILGSGVIMVRRPGRLPPHVDRVRLGENREHEVQLDTVSSHDRILICDDLLVSGQTAETALALFQRNNIDVVGFSFLMELNETGGRLRLEQKRVESVLRL